MEILLLGTGSGDGWPNPFCDCASCQAVRALGPSAVRGQSSALIDDVVLLDAGPDVGLAASRHGASLDGVKLLLLTHSHPDHVGPQLLLWRHWARRAEPVVVAGPPQALALLDGWLGPDDPVTLHALAAGDELTHAGYAVRALAANHGDEHVGPGLLYDVTGPDGDRLLYATDTGLLPASSIEATTGAAYDLVLLEETWGDLVDAPADHLGLATFAATVATLRASGAVTPATRIAPIHLSHRNPPPAELARRLAEWDVELHPDGAVLTVGPGSTPPQRRTGARRVLVIGGARSGKSRLAEEMLAASTAVTYVATSPTGGEDAEWATRVAAHRARRQPHWSTVETTDVAGVLSKAPHGSVLVDCLTLWLTETMTAAGCWDDDDHARGDAEVDRAVDALVAAWRAYGGHVVAVTNEVGLGVVPATASGRRFRDAMGRLNAAVAAESDEVWLLTAGIPHRVR